MHTWNVLCAGLIGAAAIGLVSCATTTAPVHGSSIRAVSDPAIIERGRHLVYGAAHCVSCHGDPSREKAMRSGQKIPLSGGRVFELGIMGSVVAPNITSDRDSGIGALSDDVLVRALRYGISREGRPLVPVMSSFVDLSDDDLRAILSYLRTLPPVPRAATSHTLTWVGRFAVRYGLEPAQPAQQPPKHLQPLRTAEYGRYLADTVANCRGCHTRRSRLTGAFIGTAYAGGWVMKEKSGTFVTPNLTPAPDGMLHSLSEEAFIARFRIDGRGLTGSPMPWEAYRRMSDDDLGAIYRYLKNLSPNG